MKKFFSMMIAVLFLISLSATAFAANFSEPNADAGKTELVSVIAADGTDLTAKVSLTKYEDRASLEDTSAQTMENAYNSIDTASEVKKLNEDLEASVKGDGLVVSDLFDLSALEDISFPLTVTVKNDCLGDFIALMRYAENGWKLVSVDLNNDTLSFKTNELGCFAIVIAASGEGGGESIEVKAGNFVNSVANAGAPSLSSAMQKDGKDILSLIVITPFDKLKSLPSDLQKQMKDAYKSIRNAKNLADLNDELKSAVGDKTIAVSDLFDIRAIGDVSYNATISIKDEKLANFAALLHFVDGEWLWVDAEVDGNELKFDVDSLSPFAIVLTVETSSSAKTGESVPYAFILGAVMLAGASAWFFFRSRKVEG